MKTSLHKAIKNGDIEQVRAIIKSGADLREKNIYGRTPRGVAIQFGQKEIAKLLKENDGPVDKEPAAETESD